MNVLLEQMTFSVQQCTMDLGEIPSTSVFLVLDNSLLYPLALYPSHCPLSRLISSPVLPRLMDQGLSLPLSGS